MEMLNKSIPELQKIIKSGDAKTSGYAAQIIRAISEKKPDEILKNESNNLHKYLDNYNRYSKFSIEDLKTELININELSAINIIIVLHLINSFRKKSNIRWPKLQSKTFDLNTFTLPVKVQKTMIHFLSGLIEAFPENSITATVSEWAEANRSIGAGLTANPGPFSFDKAPYLREIADNLSDNSPIRETYVIKATQIGFTVCVMENHIGYCIEYGIGPLLYVSGDQTMAEEQMEKRVDEMIESAGLQSKIKANVTKRKGKSTGDRTDSKSYGGTFMRAIGPNSESKSRSFPARILHLDELDVYPQQFVKNGSSLGDPVESISRRQDSYGPLRKTLGGSTPKGEGSSRIFPLFEQGDKRFYNILCPSCGHQHPLTWSNFKWDKTEDRKPDIQYTSVNGVEKISKDPTYFECPECNYRITEKEKSEILREYTRGGSARWIPTKKPDRPFCRSYCIPAWYGFRSWMEIAIHWERVKDDPFLLPDFVNNVLAETWKESEFKPDENQLFLLAQEFELWPRGSIKKDILFLTLQADIQKDRIEAGLMGWGRNRQGYMIDYWTFEGNPSMVESQVWQSLREKITALYRREDGQEMNVQIALIDRQYLTDTVDLFCDTFHYDPALLSGVYPMESRETLDKLVKNFKSNIKTPVIGIHDQEFKRALYNILRKRPQGPEMFPGYYLHFSNEYGPEFYKQLTSEEIIPIKIKGVTKGVKILNTKQRRNEVLDITKMGMAALQLAMDKYFEILNDNRKLQKLPEIQEDSGLFFDYLEAVLLG